MRMYNPTFPCKISTISKACWPVYELKSITKSNFLSLINSVNSGHLSAIFSCLSQYTCFTCGKILLPLSQYQFPLLTIKMSSLRSMRRETVLDPINPLPPSTRICLRGSKPMSVSVSPCTLSCLRMRMLSIKQRNECILQNIFFSS